MSKLKVQMKFKVQIENSFIFGICHSFDICLPAGRQGFWHLEFSFDDITFG